jgi:hypothetical protein
MRILIFDTNVVFAHWVGKILQTHLKSVELAYAHDQFVLLRRLEDKAGYDLVLADVEATHDSQDVLATLHQSGAEVVLWSNLKSCPVHAFDGKKIGCLLKPESAAGVALMADMVKQRSSDHLQTVQPVLQSA